jgi:release factor glutamine methyltransferase
MTLRQALTAASTQLIGDPHLEPHAHRDAELLLLHILQVPRTTLIAYPDRELTHDQQAAYEAAVNRRLHHEPIQYITGHQEFYGLDFAVTPAVLIPRPETEHLIEAVLAEMKTHLQKAPPNESLKIADIGTGSGILAITLAVHLPQAQITAIDLSPEALKIAEANARKHKVADRIHFLQSDLLLNLAPNDAANSPSNNPAELYDAIVSNPPYIPDTDRPQLHPEVREHEPATALFAGPEGLDIYCRLIPQAYAALKPNGLLALEIGHGQRESLTSLLANWQDVVFVDDLQRIPRVALATKK